MERQRQSIPIQGIDLAESDDTVTDGACEDIYNLRYRAGVFETVRKPLVLHPIAQDNGFSIVHRLDAMEAGEYLAEKESALWRVKIENGIVSGQEKVTDLPPDAVGVRYFHFGNVLYVNYEQEGGLQELSFRYKEGKFIRVDLASLEPPRIDLSCEYKSVATEGVGMYQGDEFSFASSGYPEGVYLAHVYEESSNPQNNKKEFFFNKGVQALTDKGYITGTACLFAAYKLFDGSIVKPSEVILITADSQNGEQFLYRHLKRTLGTTPTSDAYYYGRRDGVKPTVMISIPDAVADDSLIESVMLFSTRNVDTYCYEKVHENFSAEAYPSQQMLSKDHSTETLSFCSHNCIWNEELDELSGPFYEIAELDFRAGKTSITLTYQDHYEHIESGTLWKPNYSSHSTVSGKKIDYNDRLHICDLNTKLFIGFNPFLGRDDKLCNVCEGYTYYDAPLIECGADWTLLVNGERRIVRTEVRGHYWQDASGHIKFFIRNNPLFYPDSRAQKVDIWVRDKCGLIGEKGAVIAHEAYKLNASAAVNSSFRIDKDGGLSTKKFYTNEGPLASRTYTLTANYIEISSRELTLQSAYTLPMANEVNVPLVEPNKIQVSYPSNPFVYAPANIYTVGGRGERIREIVATAERMTEAAYGYQPLLVFTDRAVYALESGDGEVLYARNIPILSRTLLEGTNAVEGNGAVFFVSTSGVTAIVRGQISTISDNMKRYAGLQLSDAKLPDFDDYVRTARLMFDRKESELIVFNPAYDYAYVYSLPGRYWTQRAWDARAEPYFDQIATREGVASLSEEDPERPEADCRLVTRPLKFGSSDFKRLETLAARMRWGDRRRFVLLVEGSDDAIRWVPLRSERDLPLLRRMSSSFRYHRVRLIGNGGDYLAITRFDVEFYRKFVHRLR